MSSLKYIGVLLLGSLWIISLRFILVEPPTTHYHANFAVYTNGQQHKFDNFTFYEEVAACSPAYADLPSSRAHLHDNVPHVIHIHDRAVTWGHFFGNIGFNVGEDFLKTDQNIFIDGQNDQVLTYILNGQPVRDISNRVIGSEDILLIDFGNSSGSELEDRYQNIPVDAYVYNQEDDPAACIGSAGESFFDRLKRTIGIND